MADEPLSLHIDTDWKKQAQEEKRRLAEAQEKQRAAQAAAQQAPAAPATAPASPRGAGRRGTRELPQPSFAAVVNTILTQAMVYLGEFAPQGSEPMLNLDMAKYQVDLLGILEDRTRNNLSGDEQHLLDSALYDVRTRFINVASQYI